MTFKRLPEDSGSSIKNDRQHVVAPTSRPARQPQYPEINIVYKMRINPKMLNIGVNARIIIGQGVYRRGNSQRGGVEEFTEKGHLGIEATCCQRVPYIPKRPLRFELEGSCDLSLGRHGPKE